MKTDDVVVIVNFEIHCL